MQDLLDASDKILDVNQWFKFNIGFKLIPQILATINVIAHCNK